MVQVKHILSIVNSLDFYNFVSCLASRRKWDLLLLWRSGVEAEPVHLNMNAILVLIYSDPPYHPWLITYVYASAQWQFKANFWNHLDSTYQAFTGAWVCI